MLSPTTTTMIETIIEEAEQDGDGAAWHFKYQPVNGGPIVSRRVVNYGPDWVQLALADGSGHPFFVHERAMAWAMIDWDCEDLPPYTGHPLSEGKTL